MHPARHLSSAIALAYGTGNVQALQQRFPERMRNVEGGPLELGGRVGRDLRRRPHRTRRSAGRPSQSQECCKRQLNVGRCPGLQSLACCPQAILQASQDQSPCREAAGV